MFVHVCSFAHSFANITGSGRLPLLLQLTLNYLFELFIFERNVTQAPLPAEDPEGNQCGEEGSVNCSEAGAETANSAGAPALEAGRGAVAEGSGAFRSQPDAAAPARAVPERDRASPGGCTTVSWSS